MSGHIFTYRGYEIWPATAGYPFAHRDFEGADDPRCGWADTRSDAMLAIDRLVDASDEADPLRSYPLACHNTHWDDEQERVGQRAA